MTRPPRTGALGELLDELPVEIVTTDPDRVLGFVRDESRFTAHGLPQAVAMPRSTAEVAQVLRAAHRHGIGVVTRGAGSGLSGGANAVSGCVVLSTRRLDRILEIDTAERLLVAQPGVVTAEVRAAAAAEGLFYPPDPGSVAFSTIGGNVATNAGGMCCVKYGVTGDYVLGLEAVLADGRVLRTGRRTAKGVAGYDLTRLLVGSEGTLAVITEVTVRLVPAPRRSQTVLATFPDLLRAGGAIATIASDTVVPSVFELLDRVTLHAIEQLEPSGFDDEVGAVLILQSDSASAPDDCDRLARLCRAAGAVEVAVSEDPQEAHLLLQARRLALPALQARGDWLLDDVCVPRSRIVELLRRIEQVAASERVTIGVFGHAGDGNMHPTVVFDETDETSAAAAARAFDRITGAALELGGTVTGEHGIGRLKAAWLERELGDVEREVHRALKQTWDPTGILNPGVMGLGPGPARD